MKYFARKTVARRYRKPNAVGPTSPSSTSACHTRTDTKSRAGFAVSPGGAIWSWWPLRAGARTPTGVGHRKQALTVISPSRWTQASWMSSWSGSAEAYRPTPTLIDSICGGGTRIARGSLCLHLHRCMHAEVHMNEDKVKGQWKQLAGKAKVQWGKLTDDDLTIVDGNSEYLDGKIQERYGIARDDAKRQVKEFA